MKFKKNFKKNLASCKTVNVVVFIFFLVIIGTSSTLWADNWYTYYSGKIYYTNGYVGIGTNYPSHTLTIQNSSDDDVLRLKGPNSFGSGARINFGDSNYVYIEEDIDDRLYIYASGRTAIMGGNVGIGTINPADKLQIGNALAIHDGGDTVIGFSWAPGINQNLETAHAAEIRHNPSTGDLAFGTAPTSRNAGNSPGIIPRLIIDNEGNVNISGNVGIGTGGIPSGYKLAVDGNIIAEKVTVQMSPWADFVFKEDYNLMPLNKLEEIINKDKHLPDIPSAKEVAINGVNLGEMQAKLLQKVEELTLYVIEQNKALNLLEKEKDLMRKRIVLLEKK